MSVYYRPLAQIGPVRPASARALAGGWSWFTHAERIERGASARVIAAEDLPQEALHRLTAPRPAIAGMRVDQPRLMGIVNTTPDSFSDGGQFEEAGAAIAHGRDLHAAGADILDIGGESTRPGAQTVPETMERDRTAPVIKALAAAGAPLMSIDTRKASVARAALDAGAGLINDVSGLTFDPALAPLVAESGHPVCVMHAQGDPATMQNAPHYDHVLLDVYDWLDQRISELGATGIARDSIIVDPGIGFGKTLEHNLALLSGISLFHGLGTPILLGASRKRFIGTIGKEPRAAARIPGSIATALAALSQGVQIIRIHDVKETRQAVALWSAINQVR